MINIILFVVYISITTLLFIFAFFTQYKWIPIFLGIVMGAITVLSYFLPEVPLVDYFDWLTIIFWIAMGIALVFGAIFLIDLKRWWAGLIAGTSIVIMILLTLVDLLLYAKFPLLPGASITILSLVSFASIGGLGVIIGKTASDKKNGYCIPFFEDCTKYECDKVGNCKKV